MITISNVIVTSLLSMNGMCTSLSLYIAVLLQHRTSVIGYLIVVTSYTFWSNNAWAALSILGYSMACNTYSFIMQGYTFQTQCLPTNSVVTSESNHSMMCLQDWRMYVICMCKSCWNIQLCIYNNQENYSLTVVGNTYSNTVGNTPPTEGVVMYVLWMAVF